jgi:hypothetical protein
MVSAAIETPSHDASVRRDTSHRTRVETVLPRALLTHVRIATDDQFDVVAMSARQVLDRPVVEPNTIGVIDPVCFEDRSTLARDLIGQFGASSMIVYTSISPEALKGLLELTHAGVRHAALAGVNDSARDLRLLLQSVSGDLLVERLSAMVAQRLAALPSALARTIVDMLFRPGAYRTAAGVCMTAGIARRSCDRWVQDLGLGSLGTLLRAARVARATGLARNPHIKLSSIAANVGASSARTLSRDAHRFLNVSLQSAARQSDEQILDAIVKRLSTGE